MDLRDKILAANDIAAKQLSIPEWGGVVIEVRAMNGLQRAKVISNALDKDGNVDTQNMYPDLLIASCYDPETGKPLFAEADRAALNQKNGAVLERIAQVAMNLAGITKTAIEDAEKNLGSDIQSEDSI